MAGSPMSSHLDEPLRQPLDCSARRALYEADPGAFRGELEEALAPYLERAERPLAEAIDTCVYLWCNDPDLGTRKLEGKTLAAVLRRGRSWFELLEGEAPFEELSRRRPPLPLLSEPPFMEAEADDRGEDIIRIAEGHLEELVRTQVSLRRRTCSQLAVHWVQAAAGHLSFVREQLGTAALDRSDEVPANTHWKALAGFLFLVLLDDLLPSSEPRFGPVVREAYLPPDGGTDRPPYESYRLPDRELAQRLLGTARGRVREARDQLLEALTALFEAIKLRYDAQLVPRTVSSHALRAHLAWETITGTLFDVLRLDGSRRPPGSGDLDLRRWRGEALRGMKARGRRPAGPKPSVEVMSAYCRGELSEEQELAFVRYLLVEATKADLRRCQELAERSPPGAHIFQKLVDSTRGVAAEAFATLVQFVPQTNLGVVQPALLAGGRPGRLDGGEVVSVQVAAAQPGDVAAVFVRRDHGAPTVACGWRTLGELGRPIEVLRYGLDDDEDHAQLLVVVAPAEEASASPSLQRLAASSRVRWVMRELVRRP